MRRNGCDAPWCKTDHAWHGKSISGRQVVLVRGAVPYLGIDLVHGTAVVEGRGQLRRLAEAILRELDETPPRRRR